MGHVVLRLSIAILVYVSWSRPAERSPLTPPLFFLAVGGVFGPAVLHAVTAYPLARRYGDWARAVFAEGLAEHQPVPELPVRVRHGRAWPSRARALRGQP